MKNFKRAGSFLSVYLVVTLFVGSTNLPAVFAYEEGEVVPIDQVKTELSPEMNINEEKNYVEDEVLVKYKNTKINLATFSGRQTASNFIQAKALEQREDLGGMNVSVLKITDDKTVEEKITELENDPNVEYVQPNYQYYPSSVITANDTYKDRLWALANAGQTVNGFTPAAPGADISAPQAWAISEALPPALVIVAIIDSGVAYNHPDLIASMWDGTNCKDENGVLLAGGCNHGYDYEDNDTTPLPTASSHGTHIAGIIAAAINNNKGVIGVAPHAKIMAIKSSLTTVNIIKAIAFAKQNGAKVINASWNCYGSDQGGMHAVCANDIDYQDAAMKNAIDSFPGLFITAAGNGDGDTDDAGDNHDAGQTLHSYPCDYTASNIICVTATDQNDQLADFADYGATSVDVGAPGTNIYGTVADTIVGSEDFTTVTTPNIPAGWTTGGANNKWGTFDLSGDHVLYGDLSSSSYADNASTTISSPSYDLSGSTGAVIDFGARCDTEYSTTTWTDYMQVNYSSDGVNFVPVTVASEILRWDEPLLDLLNGDSNSAGGAYYHFSGIPLPGPLTATSKVQFLWHTNSTDNTHDGCWVDDVVVTKYSDGSDEKYAYLQGTSMATPHVSGLAALLWGAKPNLTSAAVKNTILNTGDSLSSLNGKTLTGKRINAFNALKSITLPVPTNVQVASTTATSTKITWSTDLPATSKVAYGTTTSSSSVIVDNTQTTNHVVTLTGLTASTTYSFYVESGDQYGNIASSTPQSFQTSALATVAINTPYSQTITLSPGWNIVSTPRLLASHTFSAPETLSNFSILILDASRPSGWATMSELGQTEFTPLYGYFINNKMATSQMLILNYRTTTPDERLFNRSFATSGWYSFGIANPNYAKLQDSNTADTNNPDNILHSLLGTTSNYDSVVDFSDASFLGNPNSVALADPWKIVTRSNDPANTTEINSLNDFRETKGYAVYIKSPTALSGFQEGTTPECTDGIDNDGDGLTDYPTDNGCTSVTDNSESSVFVPEAPLLTKYSAYANQTVTVPQTAYKLAEYRLTTGTSEGINLNTIKVVLSGTPSDISNLYVVYGTKTSTIKSTGAAFQSWSISEPLAANSTMNVAIYGTLSASATGNYSASTTISGIAQVSGNPVTSIPAVPGQIITVGKGNITAILDASTPISSLVVANSMPKVASFKFTGINDSYTITQLFAKVNSVNDATAITELVFKDGATEIARQSLNGAYATTSGLSVPVPLNGNKVIDVYANIGSIGGTTASTSANMRVSITGFEARNSNGVASTTQRGWAGLSGNNIYAFKTKPTITSVALPTTVLTSGLMTVAKFTITADAGGALTWRKLVLNVASSTGVTATGWNIYDAADESTPLVNTTTTRNGPMVSITSTSDQEVSGSKTYVIKTTIVGPLNTGDTLSVNIPNSAVYAAPTTYALAAAIPTNNFVWSDESVVPRIGITPDWMGNYLVKNLPTDPQILTK